MIGESAILYMTTAHRKKPVVQCQQPLSKLPANRGGYYYLTVDASVAHGFSRQQKTRLQCVLDNAVTLACGLNLLGDGNYFIIVATRHVKALKKKEGDQVALRITEDENPLGVAVPEALEALLEQDEDLNAIYSAMTDGKKRSLIFLIKDLKDIDKQVQKAVQFLTAVKQKKPLYKRNSP